MRLNRNSHASSLQTRTIGGQSYFIEKEHPKNPGKYYFDYPEKNMQPFYREVEKQIKKLYNREVTINPPYWVLIPGLAVAVRRLHDVGKSGWMLLVILIPIIGAIWILVLSVSDSQPGDNQYGSNPKEIDEAVATS